jgi:hypothetical protein
MDQCIKDFLFVHYSWVAPASYIFHAFEKCGYKCDYVTEKDIHIWFPTSKYRAVVVYLHDYASYVNRILEEYLPDSFFIQHDDTDFPNVMKYYRRDPDLIFHRELLVQSQNPYINIPTYCMHFPLATIYSPEDSAHKQYDVCFLGCPNNPRRNIFINTIEQLSKNQLSHLKWFIKYEPTRDWYEFQKIVNKSKIGLNYPGNSYDSLRIWELASAGSCIIQPLMPNQSVKEAGQEFDAYVPIDYTCCDLQEKIVYYLDNNRWKEQGLKAFEQFINNHSQIQCFKRYHNIVLQHCLSILPRPIVAWEGIEIYKKWRDNPNV